MWSEKNLDQATGFRAKTRMGKEIFQVFNVNWALPPNWQIDLIFQMTAQMPFPTPRE